MTSRLCGAITFDILDSIALTMLSGLLGFLIGNSHHECPEPKGELIVNQATVHQSVGESMWDPTSPYIKQIEEMRAKLQADFDSIIHSTVCDTTRELIQMVDHGRWGWETTYRVTITCEPLSEVRIDKYLQSKFVESEF